MMVQAYPDELMADLITHELAYVYQHSRSMEHVEVDSQVVTRRGGHVMDNFEIEEDVDMHVLDWGFRGGAIDEWDREQGVTRTIDLDRMSTSSVRRLLSAQERGGRW